MIIAHITKAIADGLLHRAFSVLLFNSENKLMLQQRAGTKITFPFFWANTCCSHPLYVESELIEENAMGVKNAAVRKVAHELGITELSVTDLHFLTKLHYEAVQDEQWGEHEIDWVLFAKKDVSHEINPSEVEAIQYVNAEELKAMFAEAAEGKVKVAAWFQLIAEKFLFKWWDRLDEIIALGKLPSDLAEDLPAVSKLGTPSNAIAAKHFFP